MHICDAKKFLKQAFDIYRRINIQFEKITRLVELSKKITTFFRETPSGNSRGKSLLEVAVVESDAQKLKLESDIKLFFEALEKISLVIDSVEDKDEKAVLEYRYLAFLSWKEVAESLILSLQHVYRLHDSALKKVEKILSSAKNESK